MSQQHEVHPPPAAIQRLIDPGRFTGAAVELDASNQIFTTLPVVPVEGAVDSQE